MKLGSCTGNKKVAAWWTHPRVTELVVKCECMNVDVCFTAAGCVLIRVFVCVCRLWIWLVWSPQRLSGRRWGPDYELIRPGRWPSQVGRHLLLSHDSLSQFKVLEYQDTGTWLTTVCCCDFCFLWYIYLLWTFCLKVSTDRDTWARVGRTVQAGCWRLPHDLFSQPCLSFCVSRLWESDPGVVQASAGGAHQHPAGVQVHVWWPVEPVGVAHQPAGTSARTNLRFHRQHPKQSIRSWKGFVR